MRAAAAILGISHQRVHQLLEIGYWARVGWLRIGVRDDWPARVPPRRP